ncbi:MAG: hypothetical protein LBO20_09440 [Bifidobacteriaceae bacterium]|jgi:transglutaminase/protease-like cytokinesis protein 3|nr:hypothetical protein [Bifidobacteriaceae bacterium]
MDTKEGDDVDPDDTPPDAANQPPPSYPPSVKPHSPESMSAAGARTVHERFPDNQNAYGVLVGGKGVCASYAQAYKALADAAGIEAVVVLGVDLGSAEGHAWNKARIDGDWLIVDPMWSDDREDSGASLDEYFGLKDGDLARTEATDWMVDSEIASYATG